MLNYDNKYKLYCIIHAEEMIFHGINSIKIVHISILMQIDVNRSDLNHCNGSQTRHEKAFKFKLVKQLSHQVLDVPDSYCTIEPTMLRSVMNLSWTLADTVPAHDSISISHKFLSN